MSQFYQLTANAVLLIHMAYVMVVVLGLIATWIGVLYRQSWARNFWWRTGHLVMIVIVVTETWAGITCPLTNWENQLRELAHQETYNGDFIAIYVHKVLFYKLPAWVFTAAYTAFGMMVLLSFIVAPPRLPKSRVAARRSS